MVKLITTLLDVLGLLLVAAGLSFEASQWIGLGPAVAVGGAVVLVGSWMADRANGNRGGER